MSPQPRVDLESLPPHELVSRIQQLQRDRDRMAADYRARIAELEVRLTRKDRLESMDSSQDMKRRVGRWGTVGGPMAPWTVLGQGGPRQTNRLLALYPDELHRLPSQITAQTCRFGMGGPGERP